jgi:hypothetical protein
LIYWEQEAQTWGTPADDLAHISADSLEQAGEAISLATMILGRESQPLGR